MAENRKTGFLSWIKKAFSTANDEYIVTHVGYKWSVSRMLRETHVRYFDGTSGGIHTSR